MIAQWRFTETSPSSAITIANVNAVQNAPSYAPTVAAPLDDFIAVDILAIVQGGVGGTLDIFGQVNVDDSADGWADAFHLPQLANGAAQVAYGFPLGESQTTITPVGIGLSPLLAVNTICFGGFGSRLRLVFVAGAGTTAGATQTVFVRAQRPNYGKP